MMKKPQRPQRRKPDRHQEPQRQSPAPARRSQYRLNARTALVGGSLLFFAAAISLLAWQRSQEDSRGGPAPQFAPGTDLTRMPRMIDAEAIAPDVRACLTGSTSEINQAFQEINGIMTSIYKQPVTLTFDPRQVEFDPATRSFVAYSVYRQADVKMVISLPADPATHALMASITVQGTETGVIEIFREAKTVQDKTIGAVAILSGQVVDGEMLCGEISAAKRPPNCAVALGFKVDESPAASSRLRSLLRRCSALIKG